MPPAPCRAGPDKPPPPRIAPLPPVMEKSEQMLQSAQLPWHHSASAERRSARAGASLLSASADIDGGGRDPIDISLIDYAVVVQVPSRVELCAAGDRFGQAICV